MKHIDEIKVAKSTNKFLNSMFRETSKGLTENGAITFTRSGSLLLDFYAQAGAMRKDPKGALELFKKAYSEDKLKALKILFYLRDVRGGQGERDLFRTCLQWLGENDTEVFEKILKYVAEYGRFDDMFFDNDKVMEMLKAQLTEDIGSETPSLLAKWLPTANASSATTRAKARFMAEKFGMSEIGYRKTIRAIRKQLKVVEEKMSANNWKEINYSHVPSQASRIYKNAFKKHDETRYGEFIRKAEKGEVKINAATLYPYQIYNSVYIISDMEFDSACGRHTNLEEINLKYKNAGYKIPNLVFWNVNGSGKNLPAQSNEKGVALVSGFSPVVFKMAVENKSPEEVMLDTINSERYSKITIS